MKEIRKFTQEINENIPNLSEKIAASVDWEGIKESCVDKKRAATKKRGLAETADKSTGIKRNESDKPRGRTDKLRLCFRWHIPRRTQRNGL